MRHENLVQETNLRLGPYPPQPQDAFKPGMLGSGTFICVSGFQDGTYITQAPHLPQSVRILPGSSQLCRGMGSAGWREPANLSSRCPAAFESGRHRRQLRSRFLPPNHREQSGACASRREMARLVLSRRLLYENPFLKCGVLGGSF